jgi:protein-tyrosine kinase
MSRIDEALNRAKNLDDASMSPVAPVAKTGADAFTSPWRFSGPAAVVEARTERLAPELHHAEPGSPLREAPSPHELIDERHATLIQGFNPRWRERLAISKDANWTMVEQFRRLAGSLHQAQITGQMKIVMITSAVPADGKTLTAINLALVLSESYRRRVLLIDADLRRPTMREVVDLPDVSGLSEVLKAKRDEKLSVFRLTPTLTLLPGGRPDPDPMSGLTSARMRRILEEAAARFDWVIVDAPPVGTVTDASLLSAMVDGALLVVRAGRTRYPPVQKAIDALGRDRILGVILNSVEETGAAEYSHYAAYGAAGDK